jgi:DNA-binding transcriptional ArsR family regulator
MGISDTFKVLADPLRRDILTALKEGRLTAGELSERFGVTPAALSYHLRLLKGADLVMEYRYKNFIYYELNTTVFSELIIWIKQFGGDKNEK